MEGGRMFSEEEFLACCGSSKFAKEMQMASPFATLDEAVAAARDIWFNKIGVDAWLQAFASHPQIGQSLAPSPSSSPAASVTTQWSKGEQSAAMATATTASLEELSDWNARYRNKFGFIFLICATGRSSAEILVELKKRYTNRPILEFEIAAQEQMKIIELRLAKLFSAKTKSVPTCNQYPMLSGNMAEEDRVSVIGGHFTAALDPLGKAPQIPARTRPPITTHVLDVSRGSPAAGVEVRLEMWKGSQPRPLFCETGLGGWVLQGSSSTDKDGRTDQLINIDNVVNPGVYRISFNTGKYCPSGFFPCVSVVFEVRESQKQEHFHVPLLLSPFSFTTYRGS